MVTLTSDFYRQVCVMLETIDIASEITNMTIRGVSFNLFYTHNEKKVRIPRIPLSILTLFQIVTSRAREKKSGYPGLKSELF